jgi:hypothetical protein
MRRFALVLALLCGGLFIPPQPTGAISPAQKEVRVVTRHGDGGPGEQSSLEALAGLSEAAVVGRVTAARPSNIAPGGFPDPGGDFFSTAYSFKLEHVLRWSKDVDRQPATLEIELSGVGDHDRGTYIERHVSERYRELALGRTYLIFIDRYALGRSAEARVVWVTATGDGQSILEIRGDSVAPQATTRLALELAGLTPSVLYDKVRQISGRSR